MTEEQLTVALAVDVMRWRVAPGRFIKEGRAWIPIWRFSPLTQLADAFALLDSCEAQYQIKCAAGGVFRVDVEVAECVGSATGPSKARTITFALARALELLPPCGAAPIDEPGSPSAGVVRNA